MAFEDKELDILSESQEKELEIIAPRKKATRPSKPSYKIGDTFRKKGLTYKVTRIDKDSVYGELVPGPEKPVPFERRQAIKPSLPPSIPEQIQRSRLKFDTSSFRETPEQFILRSTPPEQLDPQQRLRREKSLAARAGRRLNFARPETSQEAEITRRIQRAQEIYDKYGPGVFALREGLGRAGTLLAEPFVASGQEFAAIPGDIEALFTGDLKSRQAARDAWMNQFREPLGQGITREGYDPLHLGEVISHAAPLIPFIRGGGTRPTIGTEPFRGGARVGVRPPKRPSPPRPNPRLLGPGEELPFPDTASTPPPPRGRIDMFDEDLGGANLIPYQGGISVSSPLSRTSSAKLPMDIGDLDFDLLPALRPGQSPVMIVPQWMVNAVANIHTGTTEGVTPGFQLIPGALKRIEHFAPSPEHADLAKAAIREIHKAAADEGLNSIALVSQDVIKRREIFEESKEEFEQLGVVPPDVTAHETIHVAQYKAAEKFLQDPDIDSLYDANWAVDNPVIKQALSLRPDWTPQRAAVELPADVFGRQTLRRFKTTAEGIDFLFESMLHLRDRFGDQVLEVIENTVRAPEGLEDVIPLIRSMYDTWKLEHGSGTTSLGQLSSSAGGLQPTQIGGLDPRPGQAGAVAPGGEIAGTGPARVEPIGGITPEERESNRLRFIEGSKYQTPMFHGTTKDFEIFQQTGDIGFHFGTQRAAQDRITRRTGVEYIAPGTPPKITTELAENANIGSYWISSKNPLQVKDIFMSGNLPGTVENMIHYGYIELNQRLDSLVGRLSKIQEDERAGRVFYPEKVIEDLKTNIREEVYRQLEARGYDSLEYSNKVEDPGSTSVVVFRPTQIKSVHGNIGTYDPTGESVSLSEDIQRQANRDKFLEKSAVKVPLYHGTSSPTNIVKIDPSKFDPNALYGPGFYMTQDPSVAAGEEGYAAKKPSQLSYDQLRQTETYKTVYGEYLQKAKQEYGENIPQDRLIAFDTTAMRRAQADIGTPHAYKLIANIERPFDIDAQYDKWEAGRILGGPASPGTGQDIYNQLVDIKGGKVGANKALQKAGYDGITHIGGMTKQGQLFDTEEEAMAYADKVGATKIIPPQSPGEGPFQNVQVWGGDKWQVQGHKVWIAFPNAQVKSDTGNIGTFDPAYGELSRSEMESPINQRGWTHLDSSGTYVMREGAHNAFAYSNEDGSYEVWVDGKNLGRFNTEAEARINAGQEIDRVSPTIRSLQNRIPNLAAAIEEDLYAAAGHILSDQEINNEIHNAIRGRGALKGSDLVYHIREAFPQEAVEADKLTAAVESFKPKKPFEDLSEEELTRRDRESLESLKNMPPASEMDPSVIKQGDLVKSKSRGQEGKVTKLGTDEDGPWAEVTFDDGTTEELNLNDLTKVTSKATSKVTPGEAPEGKIVPSLPGPMRIRGTSLQVDKIGPGDEPGKVRVQFADGTTTQFNLDEVRDRRGRKIKDPILYMIVKDPPIIGAPQGPAKIPPAPPPPPGREGPLYVPVVSNLVTKRLTEKFTELLFSNNIEMDTTRPISEQVYLNVLAGKVRDDIVDQILGEEEISWEEFAQDALFSVSEGARTMAHYSHIVRRHWLRLIQENPGLIQKAIPPSKQIELMLDEMKRSILGINWWRRLGRDAQKVLLTQYSTAAVNYISATGRIPADAASSIVGAILQQMMEGKGTWRENIVKAREAAEATLQAHVEVVRALNPMQIEELSRGQAGTEYAEHERIITLLEKYFPDIHSKLFARTYGEEAQALAKIEDYLPAAKLLLPRVENESQRRQLDQDIEKYSKKLKREKSNIMWLVRGPEWLLDQVLRPANFGEFLLRRPRFVGRLRVELMDRGLDLDKIIDEGTFQDIPEEALQTSLSNALEFTMNYEPRSDKDAPYIERYIGVPFIKMMNSLGIVSLKFAAFPRAMFSAAKTTYEYTFLPILAGWHEKSPFRRVFWKETRKDPKTGEEYNPNPPGRGDYERVGKALIGTFLLALAWKLIDDGILDEDGKKLKTPIKGPDKRPVYEDVERYKPIASHFRIAALLNRMGKGTMGDKNAANEIYEIITGMRRYEGDQDPIEILDATLEFAGGDSDTFHRWNMAKREIGEVFPAPFLTPLLNMRAVIATVDQDENLKKDLKGQGFWGPSIDKIPILRRSLPNLTYPLEPGPARLSLDPAMAGIAGIQFQPGQNAVGEEFKRLGINVRNYLRSDPDPVINREQNKIFETLVRVLGGIKISSPEYQTASNVGKAAMLEEILMGENGIATYAHDQALLANPMEAERRKLKGEVPGKYTRKITGVEKVLEIMGRGTRK